MATSRMRTTIATAMPTFAAVERLFAGSEAVSERIGTKLCFAMLVNLHWEMEKLRRS